MHHLKRPFVIALLATFLSVDAGAKPADAVPVESGSVEAQNIEAAAEFIRSMGYEDKADNILTWLRTGKIYWSPTQKENGDTDGDKDITIGASILRGKTNKESKPEKFNPNEPNFGFRAIHSLARTLFHEKVHAHQSSLFIIGSNFKGTFGGGYNHEFEAWTETLEAMDHWIHTLYEQYLHARYIAGKSKEECITILKKMTVAIEAKKAYLSDFTEGHCQGYPEYEEDYKKLKEPLDDWEKYVKRQLAGLESPKEADAAEPPKELKNSLPDPALVLRRETNIEKSLRDSAPARIPRDTEVVVRISQPEMGDGQTFELSCENEMERPLATELPAGVMIGDKRTGRGWVTTAHVALQVPARASVAVILPVREANPSTFRDGPQLNLTPSAAVAAGTGSETATLIGMVLPSDTHGGDTVSGTIVTDPQDFKGIPGLQVIEVRLALGRIADGSPAINTIRTSLDGAAAQAGVHFSFTIPSGAEPARITVATDSGSARVRMPISYASEAPSPSHTFTTPPVCVSGVQVMHGPLDGDSRGASIEISGVPAEILCESPRAVYFRLPPQIPAGAHQLSWHKGGQSAAFSVSVLKLSLSADRTALHGGEETKFHAVLSGLADLPAESWRAASSSQGLDWKTIQRLAPELTPPSAGTEGTIFFAIENASPQSISIGHSRKGALVFLLQRKDFIHGFYEYTGTIHALLSGGFKVKSVVIPLLSSLSRNAGQAPQGSATGELNDLPRNR